MRLKTHRISAAETAVDFRYFRSSSAERQGDKAETTTPFSSPNPSLAPQTPFYPNPRSLVPATDPLPRPNLQRINQTKRTSPHTPPSAPRPRLGVGRRGGRREEWEIRIREIRIGWGRGGGWMRNRGGRCDQEEWGRRFRFRGGGGDGGAGTVELFVPLRTHQTNDALSPRGRHRRVPGARDADARASERMSERRRDEDEGKRTRETTDKTRGRGRTNARDALRDETRGGRTNARDAPRTNAPRTNAPRTKRGRTDERARRTRREGSRRRTTMRDERAGRGRVSALTESIEQPAGRDERPRRQTPRSSSRSRSRIPRSDADADADEPCGTRSYDRPRRSLVLREVEGERGRWWCELELKLEVGECECECECDCECDCEFEEGARRRCGDGERLGGERSGWVGSASGLRSGHAFARGATALGIVVDDGAGVDSAVGLDGRPRTAAGRNRTRRGKRAGYVGFIHLYFRGDELTSSSENNVSLGRNSCILKFRILEDIADNVLSGSSLSGGTRPVSFLRLLSGRSNEIDPASKYGVLRALYQTSGTELSARALLPAVDATTGVIALAISLSIKDKKSDPKKFDYGASSAQTLACGPVFRPPQVSEPLFSIRGAEKSVGADVFADDFY
ncbi:hypothetical protein B0H12DRAFT_1079179 [Mycena haematopus]|nr:hypothetical protein B0H12DRAFT_1079179 [Mycena haematopus]